MLFRSLVVMAVGKLGNGGQQSSPSNPTVAQNDSTLADTAHIYNKVSADANADNVKTDEQKAGAKPTVEHLDKCGKDLFWFFALPLKWKNADGAPLRAVAFWSD